MLTALLIFSLCVGLTLYRSPETRERLALFLLGLVFSSHTIYKPDGRLYLVRFFITPRRWLGPGRWPRVLSWVPVRFRKIFLHRIRLSDERTMHDHPWAFTSIILGGEYIEHSVPSPGDAPLVLVRKRARFGRVLRNKAEHTHRLEIVRPVWTLVFAGPSYREWGFWVSSIHKDWGGKKWVDWRTFLRCPNEPTPPEDAFEGDPWFEVVEVSTPVEFPHRFAEFVAANLRGDASAPASAAWPERWPAARVDKARAGLASTSYEVGPVCGHADHINCRAPEVYACRAPGRKA